MKALSFCIALAIGEAIASAAPQCAEIWPVALFASLLVATFGHGFAIRGWRYGCVLLLGVAMFLCASVHREHELRLCPWKRQMRTYRRYVRYGPFPAETKVIKADLSRRIGIGLGHNRDVAALNRAILLGERSGIPYRIKRVFIDSGTMHVFAISGLHIMVVAKVFAAFFVLMMVPYRFLGIAVIPLLWGYVHLIGWSPSAIRAALMATFYYSAPLFWRKPDMLVAWSWAFAIIHVVNPLMIGNVSSQLSFVVMLAIIFACRWGSGFGNGMKMLLWVTLIAWLAGMPIGAHVFGRITPGGMVANLVLLPTASVSVAAGLIGVTSSFVSNAIAAHINNFSALFTNAMLGIAEAVSRFPYANFEVDFWTVWQSLEFYLALLLMILLAHLIRRRRF